MELLTSYFLNHFLGLAANLNSDWILTALKDGQVDQWLQEEKSRDALRSFRPKEEDVRQACIKLADQHEQVWSSPAHQQLRPLLRDPSFHQDFVEWLQAGGIEEGDAVKERMIQKMESLLATGEFSEEQRHYLHNYFFNALDKAIFKDDVLYRWRADLCNHYLRGQVAELKRMHQEAAGKYSDEQQSSALEAYTRQSLEHWDIIDLSGLPDDRDIATKRLLLRQLYIPLRIAFEAKQPNDENQDVLASIEFQREADRLRAAGRNPAPDSQTIVAMDNPMAIGERLGAGKRFVVLGDPGGGKTTMLRWLATAYLLRHSKDTAISQLPDVETLPDQCWIPVLIRCREIGEEDLCRSFKDVLQMHLAKSELQPQEAQVMSAVIIDRLARGEILLLIDGLDEISNKRVRQIFCQQLERTALRYPDAPILVTSRIVGYREMPERMGTGFTHGVIGDLHPETKDLFAHHWVEVTEAYKTKAERNSSSQELIAALHSSDRIERLTGNPMLLTTMALVKRRVGKLPSRRHKLYSEAVLVLLNWNPKVYDTIEEEEALPQLSFLAYEMCRRGVQQLSSDDALDLLDQIRAEYPKLRSIRKRDPHRFLQMLEERSCLLMRSGIQWQPSHLQDKAIWEFRHLTFQEYLAAQALKNGYYPCRDSSQSLAKHVAPLAAPVRNGSSNASLRKNEVIAVPDSWREALRLLVSVCSDDDADDVLLSILNPGPEEDASQTQGPRSVLAAQCLADEPNIDETTALETLQRFVALIGEKDGLDAVQSNTERVALEIWRSHPDHRRSLQACLLEGFAEPANTMGEHCGAMLAQLLGASIPVTAVGIEESLEKIRDNLVSADEAEAICAALFALELAYQRWLSWGEGVEEKLLALLGRGGAPAHAGAWALAWLSVDRVPASINGPSRSNRLLPPVHAEHHRFSSSIGWRPSQQDVPTLVLALAQTRPDETDLKRHLIGLLGLVRHPDALSSLLTGLAEPEFAVREAARLALANLSEYPSSLSLSHCTDLETALVDSLLHNETLEESERAEGLVLLALFAREGPLHELLANEHTPMHWRQRALEAFGLIAIRSDSSKDRPRIEALLERHLRADALDLLVEGDEGWVEHDRRLPPLQGASRALQLAASADLPLLGSGPGRLVPMLTLTALQEGDALRIRTEVVMPAVWKLPLPGGEQLEMVVVEGGEYGIGSPETKEGRDWYANQRDGCKDPQTQRPLNVEAKRTVQLERFALARHAITQAQWQAVAMLPRLERELSPTPGSYKPGDLWERFAQPGGLPVDSVSWNDCLEWLRRLNRWLQEQWPELGGQGEAPKLALPSASQWEAACQAGASTPFHFGETLDASWANYEGDCTYGRGRKGSWRERPVPMGFFGLVNRWGVAEMHGQLFEWCADQLHRNLVAGSAGYGSLVESTDPELGGNQELAYRPVRGGSCFTNPNFASAAFNISSPPGNVSFFIGVRPGCFSPPDSLPGS